MNLCNCGKCAVVPVDHPAQWGNEIVEHSSLPLRHIDEASPFPYPLHAAIQITEEYGTPWYSERNFVSPQAYAEYLEWFFNRPLSDRLISRTVTVL